MESDGVLEAYSFFDQTIDHFIYANIESNIRVLEVGDFFWKLGLAMETYMGKNLHSPEMKFNIYGGHWNITTQFGYRFDNFLLRLYTDHECFHNIDMADTLSEYMNNIKLGVLLDDPPPEYCEDVVFNPSGLPDGWFSLGIYRPRGGSFQKGHDFNWSIHGFVDYEAAAYRSWLAGVRYKPDFYFHEDGESSSRHRGELYAAYQAPAGVFETHITYYFSDTQPFRSLDGETYWGIRFKW